MYKLEILSYFFYTLAVVSFLLMIVLSIVLLSKKEKPPVWSYVFFGLCIPTVFFFCGNIVGKVYMSY